MSKIVLCDFDFGSAFKLIEDNILSCAGTSIEISNYKYHHNTCYEYMPDILKNGILSFSERAKLEKREITERDIILRSDESCANGLDYISVALEEGYPPDSTPSYRLKYDLYYYESLYETDILLSEDIKANPSRHNYLNECLVEGKIDRSKIRGIDIRILKYIKTCLNSPRQLDIETIINNYNSLIDMSNTLISEKLNIPVREVSYEQTTLDISKLAGMEKIKK